MTRLMNDWRSWQRSPEVQEALQQVSEGTGAPEGRADFGIFLQSIIRRRVRERFARVAMKWQAYMGTEDAQDLREHRITQLNGLSGIGPVNENGAYPVMRSDEEEGPSFSVGKHGGIYRVTMELLINDETNTITRRIPGEMGRALANYQSKVFVAFIESNPTYGPDGQPFFSTARGNQINGAAAQPNETNLLLAIDQLSEKRDKTNEPFDVEPRRIIVKHKSAKARFDGMIRGQQTGARDTAVTNTSRGFASFGSNTENAAYNVLPADAVIAEPWLNNPNQWLILGDADDRPAFVAAFWRGRREPMIGMKDPHVRELLGSGFDPYSFPHDSIDYKARHLFGVAPGEPLAALRLTAS